MTLNFDHVLALLGVLAAVAAFAIPQLIAVGKLRATVDEHERRLTSIEAELRDTRRHTPAA